MRRADKPIVRCGLLLAAVWTLAGCATTGGNPKDPIEGFNRAVFSFNEGLDTVLIKPAAQGYEAVIPLPARTGIANVFSASKDGWIALNNLLQGKPAEALSDIGRVLINVTLGIGGLFDIASELGLEKHEEDFGQTLGRWGVEPGAYVVLPFFGPRTVRDSFGLAVDWYFDRTWNVDDIPTRNTLVGVRVVSDRALVLPLDKVIEEAALDKYAYVRDLYLQRRRSLIHDGQPPREDLESRREGEATGAVFADPALAAEQLMFVARGEHVAPADVEDATETANAGETEHSGDPDADSSTQPD